MESAPIFQQYLNVDFILTQTELEHTISSGLTILMRLVLTQTTIDVVNQCKQHIAITLDSSSTFHAGGRGLLGYVFPRLAITISPTCCLHF